MVQSVFKHMAVNLIFHSQGEVLLVLLFSFAKQTCSGKCTDYKPCVQCKAFDTGEYDTNKCEADCTQYNITKHEAVEGKLNVLHH